MKRPTATVDNTGPAVNSKFYKLQGQGTVTSYFKSGNYLLEPYVTVVLSLRNMVKCCLFAVAEYIAYEIR